MSNPFANLTKLPVKYKELSPSMRKDVREQYIRIQEGKCYYCHQPLDGKASRKVREAKINEKLFPKGFFDHPVHLHHDHGSGLTLGAVHCDCNAYLWQYEGE